uniref:Uncharacterized protein n=1 Tax=viral metagenome TaxID=1070528 RepID=A0A6H1ZHQ0_9ZZZZ
MYDLGKEIVTKLDASHVFLLIVVGILVYIIVLLMKMIKEKDKAIQEKDKQFTASFEKKEEQMMVFATKTFDHTSAINHLADVVSLIIRKSE